MGKFVRFRRHWLGEKRESDAEIIECHRYLEWKRTNQRMMDERDGIVRERAPWPLKGPRLPGAKVYPIRPDVILPPGANDAEEDAPDGADPATD